MNISVLDNRRKIKQLVSLIKRIQDNIQNVNFIEKHTRLPVHYHLRLSLEGQELLSGTSSFQLCT